MTTAQHEPGRTPTRNTRPWLIFQIEEGWRHDRVNRYRDDWPNMDRILDRIRQALVPLLPAYRVAVLLYPVHFYNRNGWGESGGTMPASRIHPGLHHFLSFFEASVTALVVQARRGALARLALAGATPGQVSRILMAQLAIVAAAGALVGTLLAIAALPTALAMLD